ncbi:hypothetical protein DAPPUDRAFT_239463 [Daphnia pulex]|uniref:Uncharacterized protein n=1 Tax=Daphnia pulex TaxID=6669 RepID=E9G9E9_DAPPU|nr:hypothetical protein DAPPUDRAFT_239463 [Daphnia pulex]|eukprot:EFX83549.1 hypothetical protein DAPPUDRAFT_239463 [Daphnia pulex]
MVVGVVLLRGGYETEGIGMIGLYTIIGLTFLTTILSGFEPQDFDVEASNRDAFTWVKSWVQWPKPGLVIYGPSGCGKPT